VTGELRYLYAVARANAEEAITRAQLRGIEGGPVEAIVAGALLGVTSVVPASEYEEQPLNSPPAPRRTRKSTASSWTSPTR
jgi:hypothetical protein